MIHLFTVQGTLELSNRGCVLLPGLPTKPGSPICRKGTKVKLKKPNGEEIDTEIYAIELINDRKIPEERRIPFMLPKEIGKSDVPVGTEVLLIE